MTARTFRPDISVTPEDIEVECLTDESGTAYAVSFYLGGRKTYSKWMRLASAEKLARTLRNAFPGPWVNRQQ